MARTEHSTDSSFLRRWLAPEQHAVAVGTVVHPAIDFENTDINGRGVVLAGAGLLIVLWIIVVLVYFVFAFLAYYRAVVSPPALPLAGELRSAPPAPRIQATPRVDLQHLRAYEDSELHKYAWVDRQKGIVTIPIERAMQIIAERGIPPQKTPPGLKLSTPLAGTRMTGFEGKVEPESR